MKDLCIRESYKKGDTDMVSWNKIGVLIETGEGKQYVKLYHIPGVLISVFEQKAKTDKTKAMPSVDLENEPF